MTLPKNKTTKRTRAVTLAVDPSNKGKEGLMELARILKDTEALKCPNKCKKCKKDKTKKP